jgi:ubiquinone/menaquinone biosynthesis C-methylase UbiE
LPGSAIVCTLSRNDDKGERIVAKMVCPAWLGYFLASPVRKLIHPPHTILTPHVKEGMTVLDIGCGMGFFSIPLAQMVGATGKVICVDMQEKMLKGLQKRAQKAGVSARIETRLCYQHTMGFQDLAEKVDFALAFALVHEVPDPNRFFAELFATIVPSGSVLLAEPKGHVSEEEFTSTLSMAKQQGFTMVKTLQVFRSRSVLLKRSKSQMQF